jgi:hypothetical protein
MLTGENQAFRWVAHEGEPVPLTLYRVMRRVERLTPDQRTRIADGLDTLQVLRDAAGATGMST